jgi:glycosyltransferase involved in cell wall biosynthesis
MIDTGRGTVIRGKEMHKYVSVVPAYNPGAVVTTVVSEVSNCVDHVVVVDDGSNQENKTFLEECTRLKNVRLITLPDNQGKGHALMDGIKEAMKYDPDFILTIDSDGQHNPGEIKKFKQFISSACKRPDLVIGVRRAVRRMPLRSRIGNLFTAKLFNSIFNGALVDTQSGFRALSADFARDVLAHVRPGRYETEMRMLVYAMESGRNVQDIGIDTIYINNNANSKFRPLRDSLRVLVPLSKYTLIALLSFLMDYFVFLLLSYLAGVYYLGAHVLARVCSGTFNFFANKHLVFQSKSNKTAEAVRYMGASLFSLAMTGVMLYSLVSIAGFSRALAKPIAEFSMFLANYMVLNKFVFSSRDRCHT